MMEKKDKFLDCILFAFRNKLFLFPQVGIVEIFHLENFQANNLEKFYLGMIAWRELPIPMVALHLSRLEGMPLDHPKALIINALFTQKTNSFPFFAILCEGMPQRVQLTAPQIVWQNESEKKAVITIEKQMPMEITLLDILQLSKETEKFL